MLYTPHRPWPHTTNNNPLQYSIPLSSDKPSMQKQPLCRSKLSNAAFIKWIRSRYRNQQRKNSHYLYFPQQLVKETSIQKIFTEFDADHSGGLSRNEVYDMFNNFGINITMENLNELYDSVEVNLEELDCSRFKRCALSEQSNQVFRRIVGTLGQGYFPHNFTNMIIYIVFLSKRQQLRNSTQNQHNKIEDKVKNVEQMLKLNDLVLNNQRLANHSNQYKHHIRNNMRYIWEKINQKSNNRFPFDRKLEEEFYQYCRSQGNCK